MSLRWRFALGLAVIAAAAIGIGGTVAYLATSEQLHDDVDGFLEERVDRFHGSPIPLLLESLERDQDVQPGHESTYFSLDALTQIIDAEGRVVFSGPGQPSLPVETADRQIAAGEGGGSLPGRVRGGDRLSDGDGSAPGGRRAGGTGPERDRLGAGPAP